MSHFSVLVITDEKPTEDSLAAILQPWHEFECTGIDDEYVVDVDRTEEALAGYAASTSMRLKGPDGTLHSFFDEAGEWRPEFSQEDRSDRLFPRRTYFVPAGYEQVEVPTREVQNAADWISEHYGWATAGKSDGDKTRYGYVELDAEGNVVRCVDRTNPNKKWDWWVLGGRWSGLLRVKEGADAIIGGPGLLGARASDHRLAADQACVASIDFQTPRDEARAKAYRLWDEVREIVNPHPAFETWEQVRERLTTSDEARTFYWDQPAIAALKAAYPNSWGLDHEVEAATSDREVFAQRESDGAIATFAVVSKGEWHERGQMGWFGCASNEKDADAWSSEFAKLLDGLPPTAWLSVVDCHI